MTTFEWDPDTNWWELIVARAEATPDRRMLIDDRGRSLTFGDYRRLAEEVAAGLAASGVQRGDMVSWQLPTCIESAVLMAALGRLGARQNPVITMLRRAELSVIIGQLHSQWFIVPGTWRGFDYTALANEVTTGTSSRVLELTLEGGAEDEIMLPRSDPASLAPYEHTTDVRWVLYTSGTTAQPKGIRHTDSSALAVANVTIDAWHLGADAIFPIAIPITHIAGVMLLSAQMRQGFVLGLLDAFDPVEAPLTMARMGATHLGSAVPFFLAYLAAQRRHGDAPLFADLRVCIAGGAPLPPELHEQVKNELGGRGIINAWGLTECPSPVSVFLDDPEFAFKGTVGRPGRGVEVKIVADDDQMCGPGEEGELRLKAPQLFAGYVDSSLDAAAFDEEGFLRTGDLGRRDDLGYITITGRIKDIIIRNAENISAVEVENVLHQHPAINDVAVVGLPDPRTGERACAVIVVAPGAEPPTLEQIAAHCKAQGLARLKTPEQLEFRDALPRNSMGKILKHELRATLLG